jgi:hypothetical protein
MQFGELEASGWHLSHFGVHSCQCWGANDGYDCRM